MRKIDLFGCRLKLTRAKRHIRDLESLFDSFINDNPHRIEFREDKDGVEVCSVFDRPLPNETSVIIGDAIHNLRTTLDHLAASAVRANGKNPTRNTGFPIYLTEEDFNGGVTSKLAGAPEAFINFVKSKKPYKTLVDGSVGNVAIWHLSQLDNLDKHLVILPTISVLSVYNVEVKMLGGGSLTIGKLSVSGNNRVARIMGKGAQYKADPNADFSVRFSNTKLVDDEDVIDLLSAFENSVKEIVDEASHLNI